MASLRGPPHVGEDTEASASDHNGDGQTDDEVRPWTFQPGDQYRRHKYAKIRNEVVDAERPRRPQVDAMAAVAA
jgi:hypothetical protein